MTTQPAHTLNDVVASNIRALMARTRTRQQPLADVLGMTQGAVSKKLNGDRPFTLEELEDVAGYFGVPIASLFDPPTVVPFPRRVDDTHTTGQHAAERHTTLALAA